MTYLLYFFEPGRQDPEFPSWQTAPALARQCGLKFTFFAMLMSPPAVHQSASCWAPRES